MITQKDNLATIRRAALASVALGALLAVPAYAQAQTAAAEEVTDEEEEDVFVEEERIVVTGSRVKRDAFSSISPVQVIDGEVARDLGLVDAASLLNQVTVVQGQQITTGLATSGGVLADNGPGSATASLRGLGAGRTLVLVNGRRLAPAGVRGAPSAPDLNLIPGSLIKRTDILLDGASSVYGSDAVGGVINFILDTDFEGLQIDAFYDDPELANNGGQQEVYSLKFGTSNDRGYITVAAEHSHTEDLTEREFGSFYEPYAGPCQSQYTQGLSGTIYESCAGSFGAATGSFGSLGFVAFQEGANTPGLPPNFIPIPLTSDLLLPGSVNGALLLNNPEELDAVYSPSFQRTSLFATGEYNLNLYGDMTTYFEASYSSRQTTTDSAGQGVVRLGAGDVLNPFGDTGSIFFGNRFFNQTSVDQLRLIGGLKGDLPFVDKLGPLKDWSYDVYFSYSRSDGTDVVEGVPFFPRLEQTINNTTRDPITGELTCADRGTTEGQVITCRPLNFVDPTFLLTGRFPDQEDNDYLFPNRISSTVVKQKVTSGFVTGELFDLPGGPASLVLGFEYRQDEISTRTDAGATAGDFLGFFADPGANGARSLKEAFAELDLPVISGKKFIDDLSLNFAGRYTDESNFGAESTYRIQGQYAPVSWLRFRGTYGTSYRAPNLREQFGGRVSGFPAVADPCRVPGFAIPLIDHDNDPSTPDQREYNPALDTRDPNVLANCTNGGGPFNLPGVDITSLGTTGLGSPTVVFLGSQTQGASGSNPNLDAETSDALSLGLVFEQPWFDSFGLRLSGSYFKIKVNDEVDALTAQTIITRCYDSIGLVDPQCAFIDRATPNIANGVQGEITFVEALNQNLGQQVSEGVDYNLEFSYDDINLPFLESPIGYTLIGRATQQLTSTEEEFTADAIVIDDDLGEFGTPEWRVNVTNIFSYKDFSFLFQTRFIDKFIEDNDDPFDAQGSGFNPCVQANDRDLTDADLSNDCVSFDNAATYFVHNASVSWRLNTATLRAGVNNVFNDQPPLTNNNGNPIRGNGYDLGGRTFFLNVTQQF